MATITTRSGKGSPLTNNEVDANFTNLNTDKAELSGATFTGNLNLGDNVKLQLGNQTNGDLQIYHDGSNSWVSDQGTGQLILESGGAGVYIQKGATETMANFVADGAVTLYYDNAPKIATTSTGIDVTGVVAADSLTVDNITIDGNEIDVGSGDMTLDVAGSIKLDADSSNIYLSDGGTDIGLLSVNSQDLNIRNLISDKDIYFQGKDGSSVITALSLDMSAAGAATFNSTITANGYLAVEGTSGNTGSAGDRWIGGDGTAGTWFYNVPTGSNHYFAVNNTNKLAINSTGIDVTGTATADKVTIGTSSASNGKLTLEGVDGADSAGIYFNNTTGTNGKSYSLSSGNSGEFILYDRTSDAYRLFVSSAGNVGIGTSSPDAPLHIIGNDGVQFNRSGQTNGFIIRPNASSDGIRFTQGGTGDRMTINSSGNVGIGTSSPTNSLSVYSASGSANINLTRAGTSESLQIGTYYINANGNDLGLTTIGSHPITFKTNNAERMRIDSSGRVGIGTSSPNRDLHISGGASDVAFGITNSASGTSASDGFSITVENPTPDVSIRQRENANMKFLTNNTERMRIDSSGNVGIGVSDPKRTLVLGRSDSTGVQTQYTNSSTGVALGDGFTVGIDGSENAEFWNFENTNMLFATSGTERMRIDSSGNLLVGTTSDFASGTVDGIIAQGTNKPAAGFSNTASGQIVKFYEGGSLVGSIGTQGGDLYLGTDDANIKFFNSASIQPVNSVGGVRDNAIDLGASSARFKDLYLSGGVNLFKIILKDGNTTTGGIFHEKTITGSGTSTDPSLFAETGRGLNFMVNGSATKAARIDNAGNLLVGTTSASAKLFVERGDTGNAFGVRATNATYAQTVGFLGADRNTTNNTFHYIDCYNYGSSTYRFRVADSGNVTNTNNSYGAISDIKLKENIVDATPKLDKLNEVRIVNYNFIGSDEKQLGVIAQELEQIMPNMVDENVDKDEDGNELGTTTKTVKYSVFVPMLIKAMQEQTEIINNLRNRVAQLEE